jgi:integration host factor subunit beta
MSFGKTITKKEISKRTAKLTNENVPFTEKVVSEIFTSLREIMCEANPEIRIEIRDFGVLEVKTTKAKPAARNPKTGETVFVPPRKKTHFKPGKLLQEELKKALE